MWLVQRCLTCEAGLWEDSFAGHDTLAATWSAQWTKRRKVLGLDLKPEPYHFIETITKNQFCV